MKNQILLLALIMLSAASSMAQDVALNEATTGEETVSTSTNPGEGTVPNNAEAKPKGKKKKTARYVIDFTPDGAFSDEKSKGSSFFYDGPKTHNASIAVGWGGAFAQSPVPGVRINGTHWGQYAKVDGVYVYIFEKGILIGGEVGARIARSSEYSQYNWFNGKSTIEFKFAARIGVAVQSENQQHKNQWRVYTSIGLTRTRQSALFLKSDHNITDHYLYTGDEVLVQPISPTVGGGVQYVFDNVPISIGMDFGYIFSLEHPVSIPEGMSTKLTEPDPDHPSGGTTETAPWILTETHPWTRRSMWGLTFEWRIFDKKKYY